MTRNSKEVLPLLALLFLCSFLDRTNVGNAKIIGLEEDLGINNVQYNQGLAVFYATYIARHVISVVQSHSDFRTAKQSRPEEGLAKNLAPVPDHRMGYCYHVPRFRAFGGLLARGLSAIGPSGNLEVVCGTIAAFGLPNNLATAKILTPEEREWALVRLQGHAGDRFNLASEREEKFRWSEVGRGVLNLQVWLSSTAYFAILSGLYSFGLFLPTIINDLHIASNANQSQLWSVIPYAVATPVTVLVAFLSDRLRVRGPLMLAVLPISIIGYAVIGNVTAPQTRFAMTCLMAIGMYSAVPCVLSWNSNNSAGHYKRATTSALQLAIANCGGFVATFIYPSTQGPYYHKGHTIILGLLCYAWVATLLNVLWCSKINRDKAAGKYDQFIGTGDDREPEFKMVL
ncbi:putative transporter [Colletotrichum sp. SAR11_59]|nr:putative transporter [Colletotrichum sp. SAR11_59]